MSHSYSNVKNMQLNQTTFEIQAVARTSLAMNDTMAALLSTLVLPSADVRMCRPSDRGLPSDDEEDESLMIRSSSSSRDSLKSDLNSLAATSYLKYNNR